jgi:hypothetical protein
MLTFLSKDESKKTLPLLVQFFPDTTFPKSFHDHYFDLIGWAHKYGLVQSSLSHKVEEMSKLLGTIPSLRQRTQTHLMFYGWVVQWGPVPENRAALLLSTQGLQINIHPNFEKNILITFLFSLMELIH